MDNKGIAEVFEEIGNILDIQGASFFRVNAYRKGALTVLNFPKDFRTLVEKHGSDFEKIPGIGDALRDKIVELVTTGKCKEHERLKKGFPKGLLEMLHLRGLGPKKVKLFFTQLAIKNISELKKAAEKGLIRTLDKMGEKSEAEILKAIEEYKSFSSERSLVHEALQEAERYIAYMKKCKDVTKIEYAGSLRRRQETIGDIDILVPVKDPKKVKDIVMKHFTSYDEVFKVVAEGDTKSSVILKSGINVDLRVVANESFGAALHYFTGSKEHNVKIRDIAKKKGMKVNEYGLYKGEEKIAGETEEGMFKALGLPYVPPEIRRNDGEIEYGKKHQKFPKFVELKDMKADLHSHSKYSDGKNTIEEMAEKFISLGYEYFAVTDHSKLVGITGGMDKKKIQKQWKEIEKVNKKLKGKIQILKGVEVDILKDGQLDFEDEILKQLDVVIISAHMYGRLAGADQTKRLIRAIENPYAKILGHPTGRLINKRAPMEFDMEKILDACADKGVAVEINSNPMRLDLVDKYIRIAKDKGVKFVINTDAHSPANADFMQFGVGIARRGWLTKGDILNTMPVDKFLKALR